MDFDQPIRGRTVDGIWIPNSALEQKSDRTLSGKISGDYSGILEGAPRAESRFRDYQSYLEAIKTVPWVYACVSLLAYSFATAPGDLVDVDTDEPTEDPHNPFLQLWNRPNPTQSGMVFRELMGMFIELAGESYISLEEMDASGRPTELYLPSPARMRVIQSRESGDIIGYAYDTSGFQNGRYLPSFIPYSVDEIIHIKAANPLNYLRGLGNIEAMETTMDTMVAMSRNELSYWQSGGRITGVLETDQQVDDDTFNRLVQRWRQFTADKRQRFKTAILEQGLKYSPVAEGFKGLDYSKLDVAKRDFVLANFGVPKNKLGIIEDAQYKSDEADRFYWSETMEPRLTRFEDHIQPLVDLFETNKAWRYERKNWEDDTVKLNNAMMMRSLKAFSQDEIRAYIGVPPAGGKSGNVVIFQQTDVPVQLDAMDKAASTGVAGGGPPPLKPPDDPAKLKPPTVPPHAHAAGTVPQAGVSTAANGNENGRTSAVDASGHLPNKLNVHNAAESAATKSWKDGWTEETLAALDEADRDVLRQNFERELQATKEVARNLRARGRNVKTSGLRRVTEYAEKMAAESPAMEVKSVDVRAGHPAKPGTAEYVQTTTKRLRDSLTVKFGPKIREGFSAQRRALTPVLSKALKITNPEERRAVLHADFPRGKGPAEAITALHTEAANEGWRIGKRAVGFTAKTPADFEIKAMALGHEPFVSPFLSHRYERTIGTSITGIEDTTEGAVADLVDEGLRRGYSPLQIANGEPRDEFAGVNSVFDDAYRAEEIARTESMFALNWGQGNALLDSGATQEEAMDGSDDPICAARNGEIYEIDPETGFAIDAEGNQIQDHPNGTLAFIPTGDLTDLIPTGAVEELAADWETKGDKPGHEFHGNQHVSAGVYVDAHGENQQHAVSKNNFQPNAHRHGRIRHAHRGGHLGHRHGKGPKSEPWTNTGPGGTTVVVGHPKKKDIDEVEVKDFIAALRESTELLAEIDQKYSEAQPRDDHGRWGSGVGPGESHFHGGLVHTHGRVAKIGHIHYDDPASHHAETLAQRATHEKAIGLLKSTGGFTFDPKTGAFSEVGKTEGFGVSPYEDRTKLFESSAKGENPNPLRTGDISQFIHENRDLLSQDNHMVGGWRDPATGETSLDVSVVTPTADEAHAIGAAHGQTAIFDYKTGESIPTRRAA